MKWKSALTAKEAAILAAGYESQCSYDNDTSEVHRLQLEIDGCHNGDWLDGIAQEFVGEQERINEKLGLVEDIYSGLLDEILLADPYSPDGVCSNTELVIAKRVQQDELDTTIAPELCTATKLSLAKWFWKHDHSMAKIFWPSITEELASMPSDKGIVEESPLSPKRENTYLRTIQALSEALIGNLTGKPNTDAVAVLAALAAKSVEAPLKERALSDYLKEAQKLD